MRDSLNRTWQRILDGDPSAWDELVGHYSALVYSTALRCGLTSGDAEDCAQHTWMSLYTGRRAVRDPSKLPSWLISTASRTARRLLRRRTSLAQIEQASERIQPSPEPDEAIARLQQRAVLERALTELDPKCEVVLRSLFLSPDEPTYEEVARQLRIPANSLGPVRMRCLKKLKTILENLGQI